MKARVFVTVRKGVLDPQGTAVERALHQSGFTAAQNVRIGKVIEMNLDPAKGLSREQVEAELKKMCDRFLANTVIEDYRMEIEP